MTLSLPCRLNCTECGWSERVDQTIALERLRVLGSLRKMADPEPALVEELFRTRFGDFRCGECGKEGLEYIDDDLDDEFSVGTVSRRCEQCSQPIDAERLAILPLTTLCIACQSAEGRGDSNDPPEFCPHCGSVMRVALARGAGIAKYVLSCPDCRR